MLSSWKSSNRYCAEVAPERPLATSIGGLPGPFPSTTLSSARPSTKLPHHPLIAFTSAAFLGFPVLAMRSLPLAAALLSLLLAVAPLAAGSAAEAAPFLLEGNKLLSQGSYAEAARQFGDALRESSPRNARSRVGTAAGPLHLGRANVDHQRDMIRLRGRSRELVQLHSGFP